ncbi:MAG: hypothetical protein IKP14_05540 [Clostridiales bacterium]|nr:hypothetical protein [Clostridiales bacterium]MBR4494155.1 hypothetical protein [Clostridiales bacterium]
MNIPETILSKLTAEQKAKITSAKSIDEVISIAKDIGIDLTDEMMEGLAGGTGPLGYPYGETGPLGYPYEGTGPLGETGPLKTGPLGSCDPANNAVGPVESCDPPKSVGWYDK